MQMVPEFVTMFTTFIHNKLDLLIPPKQMLLGGDKEVFESIRACIGSGESYRADIASVLVTRLINWSVNYSLDNTITQKEIDRLIKLSIEPDLFTDDLRYVLVKKLLNGNKQKFQKITMNQEVIKMAMK